MNTNQKTENINGQPTAASPVAVPTRLDFDLPNFVDPISRLDETDLTPEQKERFKQIGIDLKDKAKGVKIVLMQTPCSGDSAIARMIARASEMPTIAMISPSDDEKPSERAAIDRRDVFVKQFAAKMGEAIRKVGEGAANTAKVIKQMNGLRSGRWNADARVKIDVTVGKRRQSDANKKEKDLKSGFPLSERNLAVLKSVKEKIPESLEHFAATGGTLRGGLGILPIPAVLKMATELGKNIRDAYIKTFLILPRAEAMEKAKEITGFGDARLEKLFKRAKNKRIAAGRPACLAAEIWASVCIDALTRKAQKRTGSNSAFMENELSKIRGSYGEKRTK
jgi:hypothetical protein